MSNQKMRDKYELIPDVDNYELMNRYYLYQSSKEVN